ncbi:class I SAM-dependent DNA methyltransferase [Desulfobulbus alkaliphilus]|uniref:class I SAM-dependent DNA methyltransferase n=1 Tax=Desulfobulbus alkaliphilus TaxID=869814 RepID=UPI0019645CE1|nr:class I SAM-dependent methyltransferase [Desulfobulbus alkaliphilus]MBM9537801.1 class I SAM-dependent methyltransferase [Desulfobulbus alkaliphilus]
MKKNTTWLGQGSTDSREVATYYDEWAPTYEASLDQWTYRAPQYAARLLATHSLCQGPVFDAGCGTGLTGRALKNEGFESIIGTDISSASIEQAMQTGVYTSVQTLDLQQLPLPFTDNMFAAVNCVGVLTYIEALRELLHEFVRVTVPNGLVVFTHRDDLLYQQNFPRILDALEAEGLWGKVFVSEPELYLPGNEEFADRIRVVYFVYRVRSGQ